MLIRFAALVIVIATLIWSLDSKPDYTDMSATCMGNKGSMDHVVATCSTLMEVEGLRPVQHSKLLSARGWAYYTGKRYDQAIVDYNAAAGIQPEDATPVLRRALALDAMGDATAAEADFARVLTIDPNSTDALYGKAGLEARHGNIHAAIRLWEQVLEIDPTQIKAGTSLVNAHFKLNGIDGSQQFLAQAETRWPDQALIPFLQLLFDLNVTGDHESALKAVKRLTQLTPDSEGAEVYLAAFVHLKIGDEQAGVKLIHKFAKLSQRRSWVRKGFVERSTQRVIEWLTLRGNREWITRSRMYAEFGRTDLAKLEIDTFLQDAGRLDRSFFFCLIREAGVSVPPAAEAGSAAHLDKTVKDYVQKLAASSGIADIGPQ